MSLHQLSEYPCSRKPCEHRTSNPCRHRETERKKNEYTKKQRERARYTEERESERRFSQSKGNDENFHHLPDTQRKEESKQAIITPILLLLDSQQTSKQKGTVE